MGRDMGFEIYCPQCGRLLVATEYEITKTTTHYSVKFSCPWCEKKTHVYVKLSDTQKEKESLQAECTNWEKRFLHVTNDLYNDIEMLKMDNRNLITKYNQRGEYLDTLLKHIKEIQMAYSEWQKSEDMISAMEALDKLTKAVGNVIV
jgi:uncharacterized Zn finger protein (UPF0148 family)